MNSWHPQMLVAIEKAKRIVAKANRRGKRDGFNRYKIGLKEGKQ